MRLLPSAPLRWIALAGYAALGLVLVASLALALFPIGLLKPTVERRLSERFGRPVTIGSIERTGGVSLHPQVIVRGLRVPQPAWAGRGDLARIARAELTLATGPLLRGRVVPTAIRLSGAHFALVRDRAGRENWHRDDQRDARSPDTPVLQRLTIADSALSYRDDQRDRRVALRLFSDPRRGLVARGPGLVRGSPVRIALRGGAIGARSNARWPFAAAIDGADLAMRARGTMASPLDTDAMALDVTARATDLRFVDAVIEAGLFATRPVRLAAHVERRAPAWRITGLSGTIGRSRIAGEVEVVKGAGRTRIAGWVRSPAFDPSDLSSDASRAHGAALTRAIGPRLVPDTRVDLSHMRHTDGTLAFHVDRLLNARGGSGVRSAAGVLTLDHQRLTVSPLTIGLTRGAVTGRVIVDQRGGAAVPRVAIDLRLADGSIAALAGGGGSVTGRVDARARLVGRGATIRAAVGASSGRIALVARDGSLPRRIADALGFDAGRALLAGGEDRAGLRCVIFAATLAGGRGRVAPLIVDTSESRLDGVGTIAFPDEALAIRLTGAPKRGAVLRLPGEAYLTGTIEAPDVIVPRDVKSVGNVLKALARAITGQQGPRAEDADCTGWAARVLR